MNVLEKILEEIEEATFQEDAPIYMGDMEVDGYVRASRIEEIIRSHMDDGKGINAGSKSDWIPCSERLPNEIEFQEAYCRNQYAAEILVTIKGATRPTTLYFKNNSWFDEERNYYEVVAWQPLPEPYKGGKENE